MRRRWRSAAAAGALLSTMGCGAGSPARRGTESYAQAVDSPTAVCQRTPAYCARVAGEETVLAGGRAAPVLAAAKAWEALDEATRKDIDALLLECARWADARVNEQEFGGRPPTLPECDQTVGGTKEHPVTRAMRLGGAKHALALQCTREKLDRIIPGRFSLEQRYRLHPETRQLERISHAQELEMLRNGGRELTGSVVPDVVITTGNPLQIQRVYDFKFPCPEGKSPTWRRYPPRNQQGPLDQREAYRVTFGESPAAVTPKGIYE